MIELLGIEDDGWDLPLWQNDGISVQILLDYTKTNHTNIYHSEKSLDY